jgi:hypothetical protein
MLGFAFSQDLREIVIRTLLAIKLWLTHTRADELSLKNVFSCRIAAVRYKTCVEMEVLQNRIAEAGLRISYNPPGDGLCFYSAAGFQLGLSSRTVRNMVFEYLESNRYDVSITIIYPIRFSLIMM